MGNFEIREVSYYSGKFSRFSRNSPISEMYRRSIYIRKLTRMREKIFNSDGFSRILLERKLHAMRYSFSVPVCTSVISQLTPWCILRTTNEAASDERPASHFLRGLWRYAVGRGVLISCRPFSKHPGTSNFCGSANCRWVALGAHTLRISITLSKFGHGKSFTATDKIP